MIEYLRLSHIETETYKFCYKIFGEIGKEDVKKIIEIGNSFEDDYIRLPEDVMEFYKTLEYLFVFSTTDELEPILLMNFPNFKIQRG